MSEPRRADWPAPAGKRNPRKASGPVTIDTPSSATDLFLTSVRPGGLTGERAKLPEKSGKQIERCVVSTFQIAESTGFNGEFRQWEHLLRLA